MIITVSGDIIGAWIAAIVLAGFSIFLLIQSWLNWDRGLDRGIYTASIICAIGILVGVAFIVMWIFGLVVIVEK